MFSQHHLFLFRSRSPPPAPPLQLGVVSSSGPPTAAFSHRHRPLPRQAQSAHLCPSPRRQDASPRATYPKLQPQEAALGLGPADAGHRLRPVCLLGQVALACLTQSSLRVAMAVARSAAASPLPSSECVRPRSPHCAVVPLPQISILIPQFLTFNGGKNILILISFVTEWIKSLIHFLII